MSEKTQRKRVVKALKKLDAHSVENRVGIGTPDVNYNHGWLELKCLDKWPVSEDRPVKLSHDLTTEQRIWLNRRWSSGGEAYVLLLVQATQDWLLFDGLTAGKLIGSSTQSELREAAIEVWNGRQLEEKLAECLLRRAICRQGFVSTFRGSGVG